MNSSYLPTIAVFLSALVLMAGCSIGEASQNRGASSEGGECAVDGDCESYFRCFDGVCVTPPAISGERDESTPVARFHDEEGDELASFYLELALTSQEQATGLMYREEMLDEWGMLFIYESDRHLNFWMKNTLIPLDMIFINSADTVVGVVHEAEPEDLSPRGVGIPSRYVLEINGGLARELGIESGVKMSLENVDENTGTEP